MPLSLVQPAAPVLNCPIAVYERHDGPSSGPEVRAYRDAAPADVSFTITKSENVFLDVDQKTVDCNGNTIGEQVVTLPFRRYELSLYGAELGDKLIVDDEWLAPMIDGACPVLATPSPVETIPATADCSLHPPPPPPNPDGTDWSDSDAPTDENLSPYGDDMSCNAGGAGSLVVAFALLGVVVRRRRR